MVGEDVETPGSAPSADAGETCRVYVYDDAADASMLTDQQVPRTFMRMHGSASYGGNGVSGG